MAGAGRGIGRLEAALDTLLSILAVFLLVGVASLVFAAVILRYVFSAPLVFSYDLSTMIFAWIVFLGLYLAERSGAHLGIDAVHRVNPPALRTVLLALQQIVLIAVSAYMTWIGYRLMMRTGMQIPSLRISGRWLYAAMPIGFGALTLAYLLRLADLMRPRLAH